MGLRPGDVIGVAAPSGPFDVSRFEKGAAVLSKMGFRVRAAPGIYDRKGFLAGADRRRAAGLHALFEDDDVAAIVCARGGYGAMRLLPRLDFNFIGRHPKALVGFSDITALLVTLVQRCSIPAIHGPVVTSLPDADAQTLAALKNVLAGGGCELTLGAGAALKPGAAAGPLLGGNLTTLNHLLGTGFMPDLRGCILLLEDVNEAPYRIDRMLFQMRLAGCFDALAGLVLGDFGDCVTGAEMSEIVDAHFGSLSIPILAGAPIGHGAINIALPLGCSAAIDASTGTLRVEEAPSRRV